MRIEEICAAAGCDNNPVIYLSGKNNFRYDVAKLKPYKGNRVGLEKPFHYENVKWFLISRYKAIIVDGYEADDALAIHQSTYGWKTVGEDEEPSTVICTRDKDLRQVAGWHYGWEVGNQPEYKLRWVDELGELETTWEVKVSAKTGKESTVLKKLAGTGLRWFYAQCLIGDTTDNIPGLPKCGIVKAFAVLEDCKTEWEMFKAVRAEYNEVYDVDWEPAFREQAYLVWMVRELDEKGKPVMYQFPKEDV